MRKMRAFTAAANDRAPRTTPEVIGDVRCPYVAQRGSVPSAMIHRWLRRRRCDKGGKVVVAQYILRVDEEARVGASG